MCSKGYDYSLFPLSIDLLIISWINQIAVLFIECKKIVNAAHHTFLKPQIDVLKLFCVTKGTKPYSVRCRI